VRWVGQLAVFMRETISHYFLENPIKLRNTIQIDESLFGGKRKYNRGDHFVHKKGWVFGMFQCIIIILRSILRCIKIFFKKEHYISLIKLI
jgi:hypothetical protein